MRASRVGTSSGESFWRHRPGAHLSMGEVRPTTIRGSSNLVRAILCVTVILSINGPYTRLSAEDTLERVGRLDEVVNRLVEQKRFGESIEPAREAVALLEQALGPADARVGLALNDLGWLETQAGDFASARPILERALRVREQALGREHEFVATTLENLAVVLRHERDYETARGLYERAIHIRERARGVNDLTVASALTSLAGVLGEEGDLLPIPVLLERALKIQEGALGPNHPVVAYTLVNLGQAMGATGRFDAVRPLYERALGIQTQVLGPDHLDLAWTLSSMASFARAMGDNGEAWALYNRALGIYMKSVDLKDPGMLSAYVQAADVRAAMVSPVEARPVLEQALAATEEAQGSDSLEVASRLVALGETLESGGQETEARKLYERASAIEEKTLGSEHPTTAGTRTLLARMSLKEGDLETAKRLFENALRVFERSLGLQHWFIGSTLGALAVVEERAGNLIDARLLHERVRRLLLETEEKNAQLNDRALFGLRTQRDESLRRYARVLSRIAGSASLDQGEPPAARQAFVVTEQLHRGAVQAALARAAASASALDRALSRLVRDGQSLRYRQEAARRRLEVVLAADVGQGGASAVAEAQEALQRINRDLTVATEKLRSKFPEYIELASPEPVEIEKVGSLLHDDEALLSFLALEEKLLVWVVRAGHEPVYRDFAVRRPDLVTLITRVRASLDQEGNADRLVGRLRPFDVTGANELFQKLIAPLHSELAGVHQLIVVPDDVLVPLPFAALVTSSETGEFRKLAELYAAGAPLTAKQLKSYSSLAWLINDYAVTVLPSATSLRALRGLPHSNSAGAEKFVGFGDPVLNGRGVSRGGPMPGGHDAGSILDDIRRLNRLPGTRRELLAVARALGADPDKAVYVGSRATKPMVQKLNVEGRLERTRVVAFATHALTTGALTGLTQPALVLTPPATFDGQDDGLLKLNDILELKLPRADWVILSACRTAAGDDSGEGLSGLARAFFFAGARSILVTHWSVEDRAAEALMSEVFSEFGRSQKVPPAEAVRRGMLKLMTRGTGSTAYWAHPFAWAPYFLVGEPQARGE
jgi:CHAT domain-containing protein